jgi:hypothetical protein
MTDCPYLCWQFRHFDYCGHTDPGPGPVADAPRCEHCLAVFPPVTGGSDVCSCPCHKSSYFQRVTGWLEASNG